MKKLMASLVVLTMLVSLFVFMAPAMAEEVTFLGTPRSETLIIEADAGQYTNPGWFNPYVDGVDKSFGVHQFTISYLWELNTLTGEWYCGLASEPATPNEDYTEWTIKLREGLKWSDGEDITADDVVFTMNMLLTNTNISANATFATYFESIEKINDYEVKIYCKSPFVRLMDTLGAACWGCDFNIMPEHVWSQFEDPQAYQMGPGYVCSGPYTMDSYDDLGNWALYVRRDDWQNTDVGQLFGECGPKYIICMYIGDNETRAMAAINNEVDCMVEVTYEMLEIITAQNENWNFWYDGFPYATLDDTSAKGIAFNHAKEPFSNYYFRWGLALSIDLTEVAMNIFDGVGRSNALCTDAVQLVQDAYCIPMTEWLENMTLEGTDYHPFDSTYASKMYEKLTAMGIELPEDEASLINMFGVGWWKHDPEMAKWCFEQAGLELRDDGWYFQDKPFSFTVTTCPEGEGVQASRSAQSAADQWKKFGLNCEVEYSQDQYSLYRTGEFDVCAVWEANALTADLYSQMSKWHGRYAEAPIGTSTPLNGSRYSNDEVNEIIDRVAQIDGYSDEAYQLYTRMLEILTEELAYMPFYSGIKFVPCNNTYWNGFPSANNAYDGPYWWWSCFKFMLPSIQPAA